MSLDVRFHQSRQVADGDVVMFRQRGGVVHVVVHPDIDPTVQRNLEYYVQVRLDLISLGVLPDAPPAVVIGHRDPSSLPPGGWSALLD